MTIQKGMLKVKVNDSFEPFYPDTSADQVDGFRAAVRDNLPITSYASNTEFAVGDCVFFEELPSWAYLRCTTGGTTGAVVPSSMDSTATVGMSITDGTVTWLVSELSSGGGTKFNFDRVNNEFFPKTLAEMSGEDLSADDATVRSMVDDSLGIMLRRPSTAYAVGDCVYCEELVTPGYYLRCTTAGTSSSTVPTISTPVNLDQTVTDGSVTWTVSRMGVPTDPRLRSIINQTVTADSLLYGTGANTFGITGLSALARTILARTDAANMRSDLGAAASSHSHSISDITNFASQVISAIGDQTLSALGVRYSITTNGYVCFGDLFGGLILQWGVSDHSDSTDVTSLPVTVICSIQFTTFGHAVITPQTGMGRKIGTNTFLVARGTFDIYIDPITNGIPTCDWIAVGK